MTMLSVHQMPDGFELETPSFTYWLKAGAALTLGAGGVYIVWYLVWLEVASRVIPLLVLHSLKGF